MTKRDDVIENAHHFRDAPKDCVVEYAPGSYVVTATAEQAVELRAALAKAAQEKVHDLGKGLAADVVVLDEAVNTTGANEPVLPLPPVKRGPGRPRKAQG